MKKFLLTVVTLNALALPAMAADLTPVYKEQVVWTWTGFYFGGAVGGGWMSSNSTEAVTSTSCLGVIAGPLCPATSNAFAAAIPGSYNTTKAGFLAGVEIGYNWQFGRYVLGIETDLSGASVSGSSAATNMVQIAGFAGLSVAAYGAQSEKLDYLGTVRGRAGFLVTDPLLAYVTGGFAYGDASSSNSLGTTILPIAALTRILPGSSFQSATAETSSSKRAGWTIGGGLEWMFTPNFSVKGEYLYYDFGGVSYPGPSVQAKPLTFYGATTAATADFKGSILRVGLNFKL
jgi:outer membrane immunogenic protein